MIYKKLPLIVCLIIFIYIQAESQKSKGGVPYLLLNSEYPVAKSIDHPNLVAHLSLVDPVENIPDALYAIAEDLEIPFTNNVQKINWPGQSSTWLYVIDNPRNDQLQILFKAESLPKSARLFISDAQFQKIDGAYDINHFSKSRRLLADPHSSRKIMVMLDLPSKTIEAPKLRIEKIYRTPGIQRFPGLADQAAGRIDTGFGASYPCHVNVNCPEGQDYEDPKRGVVRVHMVLEEGLGWCSGALINNTANDETPYILTAFHCQDGYTPFYDLWRFDFNYESETCADPPEEPARLSNNGCQRIAGRQESDFLLLRMDQEVPPTANAYFIGWNRMSDYLPESGAIIHHPAGDVKKISIENTSITIFTNQINWSSGVSTPANHHYRSDFDVATHQPGSSGSAFLDNQGRIIGQLHGGLTDDEICDVAVAYLGRFELSWDEGTSVQSRLREWLDPLGLDVTQWDGIDATVQQTVSVEGVIATPLEKGIANVEIAVSGFANYSTLTDINGQFVLEDLLTDQSYELSISKEEAHGTGISGSDMVLIINHLLGIQPFANNFSTLAADSSNDGNLSAVDLVQMRNVILGLWDVFPNNQAWHFVPGQLDLTGQLEGGTLLDIKGYKTGDVNFSADPGN